MLSEFAERFKLDLARDFAALFNTWNTGFSMGQEESGIDQLARIGFETLGLQTFLTAGPKESRAWTIKKGTTAPQAAGVIHTDFERGFIKAEVIWWEDLVKLRSEAAARAAAKLALEGKDYVVRDGDVIHFKFNV